MLKFLQNIFNLKKRDLPLCFIDGRFPIDEKYEKMDIVLSPSLYWFRMAKLPASNRKMAIKLAPNVFEGYIPDGHYQYEAFKNPETDEFMLFAFSPEEIFKAIKNSGLKKHQIRNIYFAQTEFGNLSQPLAISGKYAIHQENGIVALLPIQLFDKKEIPKIPPCRNVSPKGRPVSITYHEKQLITDKDSYALIVLFLIFISLFGIQLYALKNHHAGLLKKEMEIKKKYALPATSFQLNNMINTLKKIEKNQLHARKVTSSIDSFLYRHNFKFKLKTFSIKKEKIVLAFDKTKDAEANRLKDELSKIVTITSAAITRDSLIIKGKL